MGWISCDLLSIVSSRMLISWSVCMRIEGCDEVMVAAMAYRIIVRFYSLRCCMASFKRKSLKLLIALFWTLALLSWIILHLMSTS